MPRRAALPVLGAVLLMLAWLAGRPPAALAHAEQARTDPQPGAALSAAPKRVDVWFTERLTPGVYTSDVDLSMAGAWLADVTVALDDGRTTQLQLDFNVRSRGLFGSVGKVVYG
jgi:methionine-rich copper-binding protein CopC